MFEITPRIKIPLKEIEFDFVRGSGSGGQKINKTSSCVVLRWNLLKTTALSDRLKNRCLGNLASQLNEDGSITIRSQRFRDRGKNITDVLEKLKIKILKGLEVPKKRVPTRVPKASKERRRGDKKRRSEIKKNRRVDY